MKGIIVVVVCVSIMFVAVVGVTKALQQEVTQQVAAQKRRSIRVVCVRV